MINCIMTFLGGGIGSLLRYLVKVLIDKHIGIAYPWATFIVNILGCLFLGFVFVLFINKTSTIPTHIKLFLTVGIAGGFTTFSAYSLEIVELLKAGQFGLSFIYAGSSVILGIVGVYAGMTMAKTLI